MKLFLSNDKGSGRSSKEPEGPQIFKQSAFLWSEFCNTLQKKKYSLYIFVPIHNTILVVRDKKVFMEGYDQIFTFSKRRNMLKNNIEQKMLNIFFFYHEIKQPNAFV